MFDAAQQTVIAISRAATAGCANSFLDGRLPHSQSPIYGLDRLYFVDGKPLHVIRNLSDGTQQMLDPKTGEVLRLFGRNPKKGTPSHYIKQKAETVALVPGDPAHVAIVHLIFTAVYRAALAPFDSEAVERRGHRIAARIGMGQRHGQGHFPQSDLCRLASPRRVDPRYLLQNGQRGGGRVGSFSA